MAIGRNEPCPCESGKKYKQCCLAAEKESGGDTEAHSWSKFLLYAIGAAMVFAVGALVLDAAQGNSGGGGGNDGRVWSEAHGHWHDEGGGELPSAGTSGSAQPADPVVGQQAPGPAPAGKVWSAEHGHWHDAPGAPAAPTNQSSPGTSSQPSGPAPPGKVWSDEHGHYH